MNKKKICGEESEEFIEDPSKFASMHASEIANMIYKSEAK